MMPHKELQDMGEKDLELLLGTLLTTFYEKPPEESYQIFRRDIERLILSRDTNEKYRSQLLGNLDDLVTKVVFRFTRINRKLRDAGSEIEHFYGMLNNRVDHVYKEELRRIINPSPSLDDPNFAEQPAGTITVERKLEEDQEKELKLRCQRRCLASLPKANREILLEYYGAEHLPPKERVEAHVRLALRQGNTSLAEATPERIKRLKNNLESKISKLRNKVLQPCVEKCLKQERSRLRRRF